MDPGDTVTGMLESPMGSRALTAAQKNQQQKVAHVIDPELDTI